MQMSSGSEQESSIFPLICVCLFVVLAWNLFLISSSVLRLLSIHEASKSTRRSKKFKLDHLDARSVPWHGRNQFLAGDSVENECNYVDFVPVLESAKIDASLRKRLFEETFQDIREFFLKDLLNNLEDLMKNGDVRVSVKMIETNIENDMDNESSRTLNDHVRVNMDFDVSFVDETTDSESPINEDRNLKKQVRFRETCTISPSVFMDLHGEKFSEETTMKTVSMDPRDQIYTVDAFDRETERSSRSNNEERLVNLEMKIEERPEATVSRFLAKKFLASILQESGMFKIDSGELLSRRTIDSETNASDEAEHPFEKHIKKEEKEEDKEEEEEEEKDEEKDEDQNHSKVAHKVQEFLSSTSKEDKDNEVCPRKEGDYPYEQFGVVSEKGTNCTEEKSVIHSCKNETQSRSSGIEKEEEVGPPPETNLLKNDCRTESTISLGRSAGTSHGKEEEDLNAIIRRMIILELKKHRKKKQTVLKRALSDTESVLPRKRHHRTGLFSGKGRTFFRDLLELEERLRKGYDDASDSDSTEAGFDETIVQRKDSSKQDETRSKNDVEVNETGIDREHDSIDSMTTARKVGSNIELERKVNAPCLRDTEAEQSIRPNKISVVHQQIQTNKSTQTEHVYVIRAVRSCPLRNRRLPLQFQLHRLASGRDAVCSKTVYASLDFSRFIFRKASDNLIYEKGKASHSPSYIPVPERHRWRYVTPKRAK